MRKFGCRLIQYTGRREPTQMIGLAQTTALAKVVVGRQELALPPAIKLDQVNGLRLFTVRLASEPDAAVDFAYAARVMSLVGSTYCAEAEGSIMVNVLAAQSYRTNSLFFVLRSEQKELGQRE